MPKFLGSALDIPAAATSTQAVRKAYVDAIGARVTTLESSGGSGGSGGTTTGGQTLAVRSAASAINANAGDFVLADATNGSFAVTLPSTPPTNTSVAVKKVDSGLNLVTVVGAGSSKIDGDATCDLTQPQSGAVFVFDGVDWRVESTVIFDPGAKNFTYRGTWSSTVTYGVNDVVFYNRNAYVAILGSLNVTPTVDATSATWGLLVLHGTDGTAGATGPAGTAATVTAGTASPLAAGASPTVSNSGSTSAAVFNFGIPAGATGPAGTNGTNGTSFTYRGLWVSGTSYAVNDVVFYQGSTYILLTASSGTTPPTSLGSATFGRVALGINSRGTYSAGSTYAFMDEVVFNGNTWLATFSTATFSGQTPSGTSTYWTVMARGLNYQGTYAAGSAYVPNDVVFFSGSSYVNLVASTGTAPTAGSSTATWGLLALQGTTGTTGTTGTAATISAGTATALAAGASPTVSNSGSSSAAVFNFGIPAGATGTAGTAATVAAGTATALAAGASPTVSNSGSSSAAVFNFGIPAGATGATGATGPSGASLTPTGSKTAAYTAAAGELVLANASGAAFTVTLPASPSTGVVVGVKKTDASTNAVTITAGSGLVNGVSSYVLFFQGASASVEFDGTNWLLLSTAGELPSGGTSGQVLTKNSAASNDVSWATSAASAGSGAARNPWALPTASATWYDNRINGYASAAGSFAVTTGYFLPILLSQATSVTALGFWNGSNANTAYMAVYNSDATTGVPKTVLQAVSLTVTANAFNSSSFTAITVPAGLNYLYLYATALISPYTCNALAMPVLGGTTGTPATGTAYNAFRSTASSPASNPTVTITQLDSPPVLYLKTA